MGSVYQRGSKLWLRLKRPDGSWVSIPSGFGAGEKAKALEALRQATEKVEAEARFGATDAAGLTVRRFTATWIEQRKATVRTWKGDESRLRLYVFPRIGDMLLAEVRAKHLADLFRELRSRTENAVAPKTVHNAYAAVRALFRDAVIEGLIHHSPCVLTEHQLGQKRDADPEWRDGAHFTRTEAEALISDARIPFDRRVLWGLMVAAGLRAGEAAGLRWRHLDRAAKPLGRIFVCTSFDTGQTKTGDVRSVPIHPTLAALLAEWRGHGWAEAMGRGPEADDLVCPLPKTKRRPSGAMRTNTGNLKHLHRDLETLGFRARRVHDLRRTFISLARADGADKHILRRATHKASRDVMEGYTTFEFEVVCREVAKLDLKLRGRGELIVLAKAAGEEGERRAVVPASYELTEAPFATVLATVARQTNESPGNLSASGAHFQRGVGDLNP